MLTLQDERSRVKEMQDGAYHALQAIKQQSRGKKDAYYQNRRFSQDVRASIAPGLSGRRAALAACQMWLLS